MTGSVVACASFANEKEREGNRDGATIRVEFGNTVSLSLDLADADARDEFPAIDPGDPIDCYVSSRFFEQMLASLSGVEQVQVWLTEYAPTLMLVFRCPGITYGLMTKEKR